MMRLPRYLPSLALAASLALPAISYRPATAAEDTPDVKAEAPKKAAPKNATTKPEAPAKAAAEDVKEAPAENPAVAAEAEPANADLQKQVDTFWHYGKIARYDLAAAEGKRIIDQHGSDPEKVLAAFENVATQRKDNLYQWLYRWQGVDKLQDVTTQLLGIVKKGESARSGNVESIERNIKELATNERGYSLAIGRLQESGELAVPIMIDYLRDPAQKEYHAAIRRALRDLGRTALNPLVAATEMRESDTLVEVVDALGDIGYDAAVPYLARIAGSDKAGAETKKAAVSALARMGADTKTNAPDAFYALAEKFYYGNAAIAADKKRDVAYVWYWDNDKGLTKKQVSPLIFNDVMAMRECEYVLKLDSNRTNALSLWIAANFKRESNLPKDGTDPTRPENDFTPQFYAADAGVRYVNEVLARAEHDHNAAVALRAVQALQGVVGQSNLFGGDSAGPVIEALRYPDRAVRFEAALTVAAALPAKGFPSQERVVPILAEAVAQTGKPNVLVVVPNQQQANELVKGLNDAGYGAAGATTPENAVANAATLPSVDIILLAEDLGQGTVDRMIALAGQSARLEGAAQVVMVHTKASDYFRRAITNPMMTATQATDAAGLKPSLEEARRKSGALPLDEKLATSYALRAAEMMGKVVVSQANVSDKVFDLSGAEPTLLSALADARPELVKAVANVLGLLQSKQAQVGLVQKGTDEKTADELKVSILKAAAANAKFFGNQLEDAQVDAINKVIDGSTNNDVRSAAGELRGALNLPADQAKNLILKQSRT